MDLFVRSKKIVILALCVATMMLTQVVLAASSANYILNFDSINSGGEDTSSSTSYRIRDTFGQQASGDSSSANYQTKAGYRAGDQSISTTMVCGNGIIEGAEACDNGLSNGVCPAVCSASCTTNSCGGGGGGGGGSQQPPAILNLQVINITPTTARITWSTDDALNSSVKYGFNFFYASGTISNNAKVIGHVINLTGLTPLTTYHFIAMSTTAGGVTGSSSDQQFTTTKVVVLPKISNVTVTQVTETTALVSWKTDVLATSFVRYGLTQNYTATTTVPGLTLDHAVQLTGLTQKTLYNIYPISADTDGNKAISSNKTFTTLADLTAPANVMGFSVNAGDTKNFLFWTNPGDADYSGVRIRRKLGAYPLNKTDGQLVYEGAAQTSDDVGLVNGTKYFYAAFAFDKHGNFASGALADATPVGGNQPIPPPIPPVVPPMVPIQPPGGSGGVIVPVNKPVQPVQAVPVQPPVHATTSVSVVTAYSSEGIPLDVDSDGYIGVSSGSNIEAEVKVGIASSEILRGSLSIGGSMYALQPSSDGSLFITTFIAPPAGIYAVTTIFVLKSEESVQRIDHLSSQPAGSVIEAAIAGGSTSTTLPDVAVELFQKQNGTWVKFGTAKTSNENGAYSFVVPNGVYYATAQKSGYISATTPELMVNNHVFHETISLIRVPVIAPIAATATSTKLQPKPKNTVEAVSAFFNEPVVQEAANVAAPTILAMTLVNTASGISIFNLLTYLQYVFTQPLLLFGRRKRQKWGVVYNSLTKQPIDLAIIRLVDSKTAQVLQTRVTDRFGRYFFSVNKGGYLLEVVKPGYIFPTAFLKGVKEDSEYLDLQHGEVVEMDQDAQIFSNIPVDPMERVETPKRVLWRTFSQRLRHLVAFSAIPMALFFVWIAPSVTTSALAVVQVGVYVFFRKIALPLKAKSWGVAFDLYDGKPIANAIVRIFDKKFNKLLETQVTNRSGKYGFFVKRNIYYVVAEKRGYQKYVSPDIDLTSKEEVVVDQNIPLKRVV